MKGRTGALWVCALVCFGLTVVPTAAGAETERVTDGGFDNAPCSPSGCIDAPWSQAGSASIGSLIGPICSATVTNCAPNSGYTSAFHWARVGAATEDPDAEADIVDSYVEQGIQIPASFPPGELATLRFALRIRPSDTASDETMTVSLNGTPLRAFDDADNTYTGNYQPVSIPLDAYVGPGTKTLRFEASGTFRHISTSFDIDDVSVTAPDAAVMPAPAGPTGQRDAALAKCKHKRGKKRKKCKQRANLLPV